MQAAYNIADVIQLFTRATVNGAPLTSGVTCTITLPNNTTSTVPVTYADGRCLATYTTTTAGLHLVRWAAAGGSATDQFYVLQQ